MSTTEKQPAFEEETSDVSGEKMTREQILAYLKDNPELLGGLRELVSGGVSFRDIREALDEIGD
ncbi:MAG: hypothetical protein HYT94_02785 [Parcubacteria group bacterium]|nr:hypothetical protein [Parcubacteria group bacterium]